MGEKMEQERKPLLLLPVYAAMLVSVEVLGAIDTALTMLRGTRRGAILRGRHPDIEAAARRYTERLERTARDELQVHWRAMRRYLEVATLCELRYAPRQLLPGLRCSRKDWDADGKPQCVGEAAWAVCAAMDDDWRMQWWEDPDANRNTLWGPLGKWCKKKRVREAELQLAERVFATGERSWGVDLGGPPWSRIAAAAQDAGGTGFWDVVRAIDHTRDLQHNGTQLWNKNWYEIRLAEEIHEREVRRPLWAFMSGLGDNDLVLKHCGRAVAVAMPQFDAKWREFSGEEEWRKLKLPRLPDDDYAAPSGAEGLLDVICTGSGACIEYEDIIVGAASALGFGLEPYYQPEEMPDVPATEWPKSCSECEHAKAPEVDSAPAYVKPACNCADCKAAKKKNAVLQAATALQGSDLKFTITADKTAQYTSGGYADIKSSYWADFSVSVTPSKLETIDEGGNPDSQRQVQTKDA